MYKKITIKRIKTRSKKNEIKCWVIKLKGKKNQYNDKK